jgi:ADP-Ribosyltransferase in polyvalent proteins
VHQDLHQEGPQADSAGAVVARGRPREFSPEFTAWFGDSKVVDENGQPLVVYHGTRGGPDIESFATRMEKWSGAGLLSVGVHFGTAPAANERLTQRAGVRPAGDRVYPVYLRLENPVRVDDLGSNWPDRDTRGLPQCLRREDRQGALEVQHRARRHFLAGDLGDER